MPNELLQLIQTQSQLIETQQLISKLLGGKAQLDATAPVPLTGKKLKQRRTALWVH